MSESPGAGGEALRRAFATDRLCDEFEREWKAGLCPGVEDYLPRVAEAERRDLLAELLKVEVQCREKRGERPTRDEYFQRFPAYRELVTPLLPAAPAETVGLSETGPHGEPEPSGGRCRRFPATRFSGYSAGAGWAWSPRPATSRSTALSRSR